MDEPKLFPGIHAEIDTALGKNPYGGHKFRVVWSESRLEWRYAEQKRKYGDGRNRWMLEKWCPPEMYGDRQAWESAVEPETGIPILGPFPSQGDYEHCFTFEVGDPKQGFEPPLDLVLLVCRCIEAGKMLYSDAYRLAAIKRKQEEIEAQKKQLFNDLWNDARPAVHAKMPEHIEMMDSFGQRTDAEVRAAMPQLPRRGLKQITQES